MSGMLIDPVPGKTSGTSSPLTTKGDVFGFATANARVPVGANTEYLGGDSTNANGVSYSNPLDALPIKQHALHYATTPLASNTYSNGASGVGATLTSTALASLSINSNIVNVGEYVVVAGESTQANNGLYVLTRQGFGIQNWILTRSSQMNKPAQFFGSCILFPGTGSGTSSGNIIRCTSVVTTVGTDAVSFSVMRLTVPNADLVVGATNTVKGNAGAGTADLSPAQLNTMTGNSGDVSIAAFGSTPTANGASLTGQAIALQPADATHPGCLSTTLYAAFNKNVGLLNSANITVPVGNTIANTTTTTKFTSQPTLPASVAAGTVIKISAAGVYSTTGSPTFNFQMLLGVTQLGATAFVTAPTTVTNQRFVFELTLIVIDNTHVEASGTLRIQNAATTEQVYNFAPTATIAVTSVNSGVLALQFTWSAASVSNTITLRQMICEVMAP